MSPVMKHENLMETNDFLAFLDDLDKKTVEQISEELNLSTLQAGGSI